MSIEKKLKQGLEKVGQDWQARRYDSALEEVIRLLDLSPGNPVLLVLRAQLTQLQEDDSASPSLFDVTKDLKLATNLDQNSPIPLIELGYFTFAVQDDAGKASRYFQKAIGLCRELLTEALIGQAKSYYELGQDSDAFACLVEAHSLLSHVGKDGREQIVEQLRLLQR
ncbi:hypothetical protein BH23PLA1_BH23PLA1_44320 [soil metagenome]